MGRLRLLKAASEGVVVSGKDVNDLKFKALEKFSDSGLPDKSLPKNRSGRNSDGLSQYCGSLPIAHAFTSTWLFFGTVYPNITVSFSALYGNSNGAAGWSLIVSFTTACRYGSFSKSDSLTGLALPIASRISSLTFRSISGLWRSSAIPHSVVIADVSLPAMNKSC
nr:hypothetical protein CR513_53784 [Ipomoea trifida]